ncbi:MAG: peptidase and in, kexin, sedolisin, partial [Candidatus Solibacter sp.]|nr:peptidase and in, kexin, sedolisin [Candidatus Solibacter sp.]
WNASTNANGGSVVSYIPETVWNDSTSGNPASGGGGYSTQFAQPSWQTGLGVPQNGARNVPDIALAASAEHDGYLVYSGGQLQVYGGTSAGTPAFAGITSLLNHYLVSTGAQSAPGVANINPRLYVLAQAGTGAFHDVTTGDNTVSATCSARSRNCVSGTWGYPAGQGYDQASGLGSVNAYNLVTSWGAGFSNRAAASVAVKASATSLAVSENVTMTATVTGASGTTPTGTITFFLGTKQLGAASLSGSGSTASASLTVSATLLDLGTNSIVARYSGDGALNAAAGSISVAVTAAVSGPPSISGVANGASFTQSFAPGMVLSIFGTNLAGGTWVASSVPLATQATQAALVGVTINGVKAPLYYVSAGQLNVQIPYETPVNQAVVLTVTTNGGTASKTLTVSAAAPGMFTDSAGAVVPASTAARGSVVTLFVTGAGAVSPAVATGAAPAAGTSVGQLPIPAQASSVSIGGVPASIQFVGIPAGLVGVVQVNVAIPASASLGKQSVIVTIGGVASVAASITVTQ